MRNRLELYENAEQECVQGDDMDRSVLLLHVARVWRRV